MSIARTPATVPFWTVAGNGSPIAQPSVVAGRKRSPVGASDLGRQAMPMASRKIEVQMRSYGVYTKWNSTSKDLPRLLDVTTRVPATIDIEFGFIVQIKGGKNRQLDYSIDHPGILDDNGARRAPFVGTVYVKTNDWKFYLGDTIWEPIQDKLGNWHLSLQMDGKVIAEKTFQVYQPADQQDPV
jgi:hypothetical protein